MPRMLLYPILRPLHLPHYPRKYPPRPPPLGRSLPSPFLNRLCPLRQRSLYHMLPMPSIPIHLPRCNNIPPSRTFNRILINIFLITPPHLNTVRCLNTHNHTILCSRGQTRHLERENHTNNTIHLTTINHIRTRICNRTPIHIYTHSRYLLLYFSFPSLFAETDNDDFISFFCAISCFHPQMRVSTAHAGADQYNRHDGYGYCGAAPLPRTGNGTGNFPPPASPTRRRVKPRGSNSHVREGTRKRTGGECTSYDSDGLGSESTASDRSYESSCSDDDRDGDGGDYTSPITEYSPVSVRRCYRRQYDHGCDGPPSCGDRYDGVNGNRRKRRSEEPWRGEFERNASVRARVQPPSFSNNGQYASCDFSDFHDSSCDFHRDRDRNLDEPLWHHQHQQQSTPAAAERAEQQLQQQHWDRQREQQTRHPPWFAPRTRV